MPKLNMFLIAIAADFPLQKTAGLFPHSDSRKDFYFQVAKKINSIGSAETRQLLLNLVSATSELFCTSHQGCGSSQIFNASASSSS